ncbi:MAG: flagellar biosynthetic protein FliQ [Pseudomonadota bacterium]
MTEYEILDISRRAMLLVLEMSLPVLLAALVIGFVIGFVQALTSIQETTLTFVPKIAGMIGVLWIVTDTMALSLGEFFRTAIIASILQI